MATSYSDDIPERRPRPVRSALIVAGLAFLGGVLLVVWAVTRWDPAKKLVGVPVTATAVQVPQAAATLPGATRTPVQTLPPSDIASPVIDVRVAQLEERIARIDLRAAAAAGNAGRAEGLLIAFAARRAIDRGTGLGYVEGQLRERFATSQPRAVAAVIAAAQNPVTVANLKQGLDRIAPNLAGGSKDEGWWSATTRALGSLIVVRREGTASPAPDERIARARLMLDGGQVDGALAEVARLPGRAEADDWMRSARRYVEAHRALDIIEASAIVPPPVTIGP